MANKYHFLVSSVSCAARNFNKKVNVKIRCNSIIIKIFVIITANGN